MATKKTTTAAEPTPVRAMLDVMGGTRNEASALVDRIPNECFGTGPSRFFRKLVLLAIAASANPDGSNAYPSLETIAHRCCLSTVRGVQKAIAWLEEHGLLRVESKGHRSSKYGSTNLYTIIFPAAASEAPGTTVPSAGGEAPGTSVPSPTPAPGTTNEEHLEPQGTAPGTAVQAPGTTVPMTAPPDRPSRPPQNHTALQPTVERQAGWLAEQLASLYRIKTARVATLTSAEQNALAKLVEEEGLPELLGAFYYFLSREKGFDGIVHPFALFVKEAHTWLQVQEERKEELSYGHDLEVIVQRLIETYGISLAYQRSTFGTHYILCELVELHSDLTGSRSWSVEVVARYLDFLNESEYEEEKQTAAAKVGK